MLRLLFLILFAVSGCTSEVPRSPSPDASVASVPSADSSAVDVADWETLDTTRGERIYVPVYSHIYFRNARTDLDLAATLSVRNTDAVTAIRLTDVRYYDDTGALVRHYLDTPRELKPMASTDFVVDQEDDTGGVGANFIVEWRADRPVAPPIVEAVMISATSSQGISFVTRGRVVQRLAASD